MSKDMPSSAETLLDDISDCELIASTEPVSELAAEILVLLIDCYVHSLDEADRDSRLNLFYLALSNYVAPIITRKIERHMSLMAAKETLNDLETTELSLHAT